MRGWSFPIGRYLGVDVRIHTFFVLLLGFSISFASMAGLSALRGVGLWLMLLAAVLLRETARCLAAAWFGLDLRNILLLPTGALLTYNNPEKAEEPALQKRLALVGPLASIGFGLLVAAFILAVTPEVSLFSRPWITPSHLLRAFVWVNLLLGALNFLPAYPLDGGHLFHGEFAKVKGGVRSSHMTTRLGQMVAVSLIVAGLLFVNIWLMLFGVFLLIGAHMQDQGALLQTEVDAVTMRDVMLTEFSTLSASLTLEDALQQAAHTLQDVFPVVRGANLVGAVSRQGIVEALQSSGNGYIQGVMTRSFETALPTDSLVKTLRRIMGGRGAQLVPVMEGEKVIGIVTPQNLSHSMGLLNHSRRLKQNAADSRPDNRFGR